MSEPLIIIGNGMAAARLADELARRALGRYAVAVIGEEPQLAYNRVLLSSVLAGEVPPSDIELKPARWWRARCAGGGDRRRAARPGSRLWARQGGRARHHRPPDGPVDGAPARCARLGA